MVFSQFLPSSQSLYNQKSHTLIVISYELWIYSRLTAAAKTSQNSATASASRLEYLGLLILAILRSGAFTVYTLTCVYIENTAAGPVYSV